jgi:hypothetical protein
MIVKTSGIGGSQARAPVHIDSVTKADARCIFNL